MTLHEMIEKKIKGTGNWTTQTDLDWHNQGNYWENIQEFLNDETIIISGEEMITNYYIEISNCDEYKECNNEEAIKLLVDTMIDNDTLYLTCDEIETSFDYNEEL